MKNTGEDSLKTELIKSRKQNDEKDVSNIFL